MKFDSLSVRNFIADVILGLISCLRIKNIGYGYRKYLSLKSRDISSVTKV